MATRRERSILVGEMVVGAYIELHSFICCLRGRRRAIERLGIGWLFLFPFFTIHPSKATLPSRRIPPGRVRRRALVKSDVPLREGGDG